MEDPQGRLRAEMTWLVAVHADAMFKVVSVAKDEEEARKLAEALSSMGKVYFWEVKDVEAPG